MAGYALTIAMGSLMQARASGHSLYCSFLLKLLLHHFVNNSRQVVDIVGLQFQL